MKKEEQKVGGGYCALCKKILYADSKKPHYGMSKFFVHDSGMTGVSLYFHQECFTNIAGTDYVEEIEKSAYNWKW
jgi:hypothetical protein